MIVFAEYGELYYEGSLAEYTLILRLGNRHFTECDDGFIHVCYKA